MEKFWAPAPELRYGHWDQTTILGHIVDFFEVQRELNCKRSPLIFRLKTWDYLLRETAWDSGRQTDLPNIKYWQATYF